MPSTMRLRASSPRTASAPGRSCLGGVVADDQVLETDALAVAGPHPDERQGRLFAERPRVLVVGDDGVELLGTVLGGLPAVCVGFAHGASDARRGRRPDTCPQGHRRETTPTHPVHPFEPLSHRALLLLCSPAPRAAVSRKAGLRRPFARLRGCYAGERASGNCFGKLTPPRPCIVASGCGTT